MTTATGRTAWRRRASPLKRFLATETGAAAVLVLAAVVALFWVNVSATSYRTVWQTPLSVSVGDVGVSLSLRGRLARRVRIRALYGTANATIDLSVPVDPGRDHIRGPADSPVTVVEYGDFECPYCGRAEPIVRQLLARFGDVRYVWRHLPLTDVHPHAQLAAEAAEAAHAQGPSGPCTTRY